ncbi:acyl-CoA-like ligand-binding transcription factor [Streptomyces sp. 7R007]
MLASRPENETRWQALRHTFRVTTKTWDEAPQQALHHLRMIRQAPSLRARYWEKQLSWHGTLLPEIARRQSADADTRTDLRPDALFGSALACLDAALAWVACEAAVPASLLLDRTMATLTPQALRDS